MEEKMRFSRKMYIFEATIEHLISILVAGSFLATLTTELGISDSLTGILSSFISLGCLFQLLSVFLHRKRLKAFVIVMSIINQLLFMLLYVIPVLKLESQVKIIIFVFVIFVAYIIYNFAHPKKINWLMSLVDDGYRGTFTANKEIVSLIFGMFFSFGMGVIIDGFKEKGEIKTAFVLSAVVIFMLMVLHTVTLIFTVEKDLHCKAQTKISKTVISIVKNKATLKVTAVFVIYYVIKDISIPFYGTYQINELGMSLTFITIMTVLSSITRILFSRFWGIYADKNSFAKMIEKCFIIMCCSQLCATLANPSNGKIMFILYYILHGIAMGGINSALINLIFDYVSAERRADSLAVSQAFSGAAGFVTTLIVSPVISAVQNNGNNIFGITIYAQQLLSFISIIFTVLAILYIRKILINIKYKK